MAAAFLLSVAIGRPLAHRLATDSCPIPEQVMADAGVRRCFLGLSLLWAVTGFVNASVALWLQFTQSVGTFVVTGSIASGALTVAAVARPALIPARLARPA